MGTKSRETLYELSVRAAAERAAEARKQADRLAVEAWNRRMLGFSRRPRWVTRSMPDRYLEVRCLGCDTNQTVALGLIPSF